jgi:hypothetical protein
MATPLHPAVSLSEADAGQNLSLAPSVQGPRATPDERTVRLRGGAPRLAESCRAHSDVPRSAAAKRALVAKSTPLVTAGWVDPKEDIAR